MPNHVTHRLTIVGPKEDIDRFVDTCFTTEDGPREFDFNSLVPMPDILKDTICGSESALGYYALTGERINIFGCDYLDMPWVKELGITSHAQFAEWAKRERPEAIDEGTKVLEAKRQTGFPDWYTWSIENWGTKWNAYHTDTERHADGEIELVFDTAWSVPEPVFDALAKKFPSLTISGSAFDEGWMFACKISVIDGGADLDFMDAHPELYEDVYGEAPDFDEEEEPEPETKENA